MALTYLSRNAEKRCDPQRVLPRAKSVIVLALNYFQGRRAGENRGRIARYAWGEDHHQVIATKLSALDQFLRKSGGVQKCYVDTGPILERDHAASAGVGWHGKSTMLLNRDLGTWFFLAEILTTLEFAADRSQPEMSVTAPAAIATRIKTRRTLEPNVRWAPIFIEADISVGLCHRGSWRLLVDRRKIMIVT